MIKSLKMFLLTAVMIFSTAGTTTVSAHVLERQGSIGAVLHIDPADDPVAGQEASLFFDFQDKDGTFSPNLCKCRLVIERQGETIHDELFNQESGGRFTFPSRDVYTVKAIGDPIDKASFKHFELDYTVRVAKGTVSSQDGDEKRTQENVPFVIGATVGLIFIFFAARYRIVNSIK